MSGSFERNSKYSRAEDHKSSALCCFDIEFGKVCALWLVSVSDGRCSQLFSCEKRYVLFTLCLRRVPFCSPKKGRKRRLRGRGFRFGPGHPLLLLCSNSPCPLPLKKHPLSPTQRGAYPLFGITPACSGVSKLLHLSYPRTEELHSSIVTAMSFSGTDC